ncbi:type I restriction-modification system subunit M N-terminal domain-containing protein, partial [Paenibacillus paridis]
MRDTLINNAEKDVWIVFDILRATLEQRQVKNVLMPMITLKYLSENDDHGFNIPEASRWDRVTAIGVDFGERLRAAFQHLEYENPKLVNVFTDTFIMPRDEMSLFKVADSVLNRLSFKRSLLHNPDPLFGTLSVYIEEVWNQILSREGALGSSEILSPKSITTLLSQLIDKKQGLIYDGTSGLNNFLIESYRYAV